MDYIEKGTKQYTRTNLALFTAGLVTFANLYMTQPLLPIFSEQFQITPATASLSLSVATATLAISLLFFGSISEAIGRKHIMAISMVISSIITICMMLSPNFESLLILRVFQGFIFAGVPSIAMAYLMEEMNPGQLAVAMGVYISGNSIGGLTGRIVMGMSTDFFSWHVGALFLGVLSLLASIYFIVALPPSKHFTKVPLNFKKLFQSLFDHMRNYGLVALFAIAFLLMGGFVTLYNYISYKLLGPPYHLSASIVGWIFIIYLVGTVSSTWFGNLSNKFGSVKTLTTGIICMLLGLLCTAITALSLKILGIVLFTFGFFGAHSIASGAVSSLAKNNKGQASSLYLFSYYIGSSICGAIGGVFWSNYSWNGVILFILSLLILALVAAFIFRSYVHNTTKG